MGDTADNIAGCREWEKKTATKILLEYGNVENAHAHAEEIKPNKAKNAFLEHYDLAVLSKKLATINIESPVEYDWETARIHNLFTEEAYEFFKELEFKNFLSKFEAAGTEKEIPIQISVITDWAEAEERLKQAKEKSELGLELFGRKGLSSWSWNRLGRGRRGEILLFPAPGLYDRSVYLWKKHRNCAVKQQVFLL